MPRTEKQIAAWNSLMTSITNRAASLWQDGYTADQSPEKPYIYYVSAPLAADETERRSYIVLCGEGLFSCTCAAFGKWNTCKHLQAIHAQQEADQEMVDQYEAAPDSFENTPLCLQCNDSGYVNRDWYGQGLQRECCPFCTEGEIRQSQEAL